MQAVKTAMCDETEILAVECNCICTHPLDEIIKVHLSHDTFCTALTYDTENKPAGIYIVKRELLIVLILKAYGYDGGYYPRGCEKWRSCPA